MNRVEQPADQPPRKKRATAGQIAQRTRVVAALGEQRCVPIALDDVIAYLAATDWLPSRREALYRDWCEVVGLPVERSQLARARNGRRRELNRKLF